MANREMHCLQARVGERIFSRVLQQILVSVKARRGIGVLVSKHLVTLRMSAQEVRELSLWR